MNATAHVGTLSDLQRCAGDAGLDPVPLTPLFVKFLQRCAGYAALERLALGAVPLQFPAHLLLGDLDDRADPLGQGASLAGRERERLDLASGAVDDLTDLIGGQGLKVVELPFPAGSRFSGAFVFDESLGPAILVDATRTRPERDYALAHQYGHFLADHDPYRAFICLRGGAPVETRVEIRAHAFAGAFLVPGPDLEVFLVAAGVRKGEGIPAGLLRQLRAYFEADDRAIVGRLLALGWLRMEDVGPLLETVRADAGPGDATPGGGIPARFLSLAMQARHEGKLSLAGMARHLDVDEWMARRIERSFTVDDLEEPDDDSAD